MLVLHLGDPTLNAESANHDRAAKNSLTEAQPDVSNGGDAKQL